MAEASVCVRGLPADVERERLEDKLLIHFLRERNGGGEISSVSIKAADPYAVITFEDSRVALSACSHTPHVLEVDGRMYELSLSFLWQESSLLNKVLLDMSVTIDCNHLPFGEETIKTLTEKFPGLSVHYVKPQRHCILKGQHSEIIEVVSHLKDLLVNFEPPSEGPLFFAQERARDYLYQKGKDKPLEQPNGLHLDGDVPLHQESMFPSPKVNSIKLSQAQACADEKIDWLDAVDVEALSLIMEADVFAYLCSKSEEYRNILQNHGVHVVDVTSAGITTLYLQSNAKAKTGSKAEKHMNLARKELSQLYQQVEGTLRSDKIPRSALNLQGDLTTPLKNLESLLPKVILSFDQTHVFIVGESSEASQAKQILLFGSPDNNLRAKQEISPSSPPSKSYSSVSESETMQVVRASSESSTMTPKMRISDAERRVRTGEEYKLAARFKNSDMGLMGFGPVERGRTRERPDITKGINTLTLGSNPSGPTISTNSSLGTAGTVNRDQARASHGSSFNVTSVNIVEEDILFKKTAPLSSNKVSETNSVICTSRLMPMNKAPQSTPVETTTGLEKLTRTAGSTVESTANSTSSLRRTNSFSGRPLSKQETHKTGINEKTYLATNSFRRPRSGSLNSRMSADSLPSSSVSRAVTVPTLMWSYIKEAYHADLNSLISGLQVSESHVDEDKTIVILKGSASSKLDECQSELQKLVDEIRLDFYAQNLFLSDFGVTKNNYIFKECCSNICSHFKKIVLKHENYDIFLMGPKSQCSQAKEMLKELFPNELPNSGSFVNTVTLQRNIDKSQGSASTNQRQIKSNGQIRPDQATVDSERSAKDKLKECKSEFRNAGYMQSPKPVAKDILKEASGLEISKTGPLSGKSFEETGVLLGPRGDWQKPSSLPTQKTQKPTTLTLKQTNIPINKQSESCVCGENGTQTRCGVFLCSNCIPLHAQCIVCSKVNEAKKPSKEMQAHLHKEEQKNRKELKEKEADARQKKEQGIQGTMMCTEMTISLPGYEQYRSAKITYLIPDGIQGKEHPNPGLPFQGGLFEAYLPLSSKGQDLLPCLEKAFKQGFTFTVCPSNNAGRARITWSRIPHKTNITGGKSGNGYPDSSYLKDLYEALRTCGIELK